MERPGGDYTELLRRGRLVSPVGVEVEAWRRSFARRRGRTRSASAQSATGSVRSRSHAATTPTPSSAPNSTAESGSGDSRRTRASTVTSWAPWLRQDDESITVCTHCTAHVYVRTRAESVVDQAGLWAPCECLDTVE